MEKTIDEMTEQEVREYAKILEERLQHSESERFDEHLHYER